MMDVLEHIEHDAPFLSTVLEKLSPGGMALITVPAMQFLFSDHDAFLKHFRRYNRKQVLSLLGNFDVTVERCHYFYTSLFCARLVSLLGERFFPQKNRPVLEPGGFQKIIS
jgi:hypothetical protein